MALASLYKYQTNASTTGVAVLAGILLTDPIKAAAGTEPGGELPSAFMLVSASRNNKTAGITPRMWLGTKTSGSGPAKVRVPKLTVAQYNSKNNGQTFSVGSGTYKIYKVDEEGYQP